MTEREWNAKRRPAPAQYGPDFWIMVACFAGAIVLGVFKL